MDPLDTWRDALERILTEHAAIPYANGDVQTETIFDRTRDRDIVGKLFEVLGPRYTTRNGGYLRILKMGFRVGDNAPMAFVELLDRPAGEVVDATAE